MRFSTTIKVRYQEADPMGFAHHAVYLHWYEVARIEMFDELGLSYKRLEANQIYIPVLKVELHYQKPAFFDDVITIELSAKPFKRTQFECYYQCFNNNILINSGMTRHLFVDKNKKPIRIPQELEQIFSQ